MALASRNAGKVIITHEVAYVRISPLGPCSCSACRVASQRRMKISCSRDVCCAYTLASRHKSMSTSHRTHACVSRQAGGRGRGSDGGWFKRRTEIMMRLISRPQHKRPRKYRQKCFPAPALIFAVAWLLRRKKTSEAAWPALGQRGRTLLNTEPNEFGRYTKQNTVPVIHVWGFILQCTAGKKSVTKKS